MKKTSSMMALAVFMLLLANGAAMAVAPGPESDPNDIYWDDAFALRGVNGQVNAIIRDAAGNVYVGGEFTIAGGVTANNIAKWDGKTWSALGTGVDNTVFALALDSSSNLYVGGNFTNAGGATAGGLAKWNGTTWSDMGTGMPHIYALAVDSSNTLYAGGYQTFSRRRSSETTWTSLTTSIGGSVKALALDGSGNVYAGGDFIGVNSMPINYLMKWDGTAISGLSAQTTGGINALAYGAGNLYIGGAFVTAGAVTVNNVAKWDGTAWSALGTGTDEEVQALRLDSAGNLYAGGAFAIAGGVTANRVAKWDGAAWSALGTGLSNPIMYPRVYTLTLDGAGNLYAGGSFTVAGNTGAAGVAVWNGSAWNGLANADYANGVSNVVYATVTDGLGNLYAGGYFKTAGGVTANGVAKWDGATWSALGSGMGGYVYALATDGAGNLYAGGQFTIAGSVTVNRVAKWDGATWSALGSGMSGTVSALATDGAGNLYAGGYFTTAGGVTVNFVAKWDGTTWSALGSGMNAPVYALACDDAGNVYAGGDFTTAGGVAANGVSRWDGSSWSALGSGTSSAVYSFSLDGSGNLYAGGYFATAGGVTVNSVAKWDGTAWSALGTGMNSNVYALARDGSGNLYAGGRFTTAGGAAANYVAQWNGTTWNALGSGPAGTVVRSLLIVRNTLFVGGFFDVAGGKGSGNFAAWQPRVNHNGASFSASPGALTLGVDLYGFYKPTLKTDAATTVSSTGGLPVTVTLDRANEIQVGGVRVNGACTLSPAGVHFGGSGATLTVEFSEDDVAAAGVPYTKFRAVQMTYPAGYPTSKEAASAMLMGSAVPALSRVENGKKIYAITVPVTNTTANVAYGAAPVTLAAPQKAPGPESDPNNVYWDDSFVPPGIVGTVVAMIRDKAGNLYVGGSFDLAGGVIVNNIAKWDGTSWSALSAGMDGTVLALALDSSGNLYAGGYFTSAGGAPAQFLAKWDGAAWSDEGIGSVNSIYALAVDASDTLYAGGNQTLHRRRLGESSWTELGHPDYGWVRALALDASGNLYFGGGFGTVSGLPISRVGKWDGTTLSAVGTGSLDEVYALAVDGAGNLYAGGTFTTLSGTPANHVAKWDGTAWSALGTGVTGGSVYTLAFDGADNLYAGGYFTMAGDVAANRLAQWDGAAWSALGTGMNDTVNALALDSSGNLYAGGAFITAGGVTVNNLAYWNGTTWNRLAGTGNGMDSAVFVTTADGLGNIYAGGYFKTAGGVLVNRIAQWDGTTWSPLGIGTNNGGYVWALAADGAGNLYAAGQFMQAGGILTWCAAKWDGTAWSSLGSSGPNNWTYALTTDSAGNLYAGGYFTSAGGVSASRIAKWNGTAWSALGTGLNNGVRALAMDNAGNLYAGGQFTTAGGVTANRVAKWDGTAWSALGTGMNKTVHALACDDAGNVYAGGEFTTAGGVTANYVAKWNGTTWSALGTGMDNIVYTLAVDGSNNLYAGGDFTTAGGTTVNCAAQWNGTAWNPLASALTGYAYNQVYSITIDRNTLVAGGSFYNAGEKSSGFIGIWQPRVNQSETSVSASPGSLTLGNDIDGFYKPALKTDGDTTVSYTGSLPVNMTLGRANEIQLGGIRVNGACTLSPAGVSFGGSGATLTVEFSEDDAAAFGVPYTEFRAMRLAYPADYGANKEAEARVLLGTAVPTPVRMENGKQIYAITVPFTGTTSNMAYAAAPLTLYTPPTAPSNPGATAIGLDTITWTWTDTSSNETGFNVYDDPGAGPPNTLQFTTGMGVQLWQHNGLSANTQYAFQASAVNAYSESTRSDTLTAWTLIEPVTDLWFSNTTATELEVMAYNMPSNLSGGTSGLLFTNTTAGTDSGWQQNNDGWTSSGLTPNTLYAFTGQSRNGASVTTAAASGTRRTLAAAPSVGNNVVCDKSAGVFYGPGEICTFTNPAGFGEGTHGGNAYMVSAFQYAWDESNTYFFSDGDPVWNAGPLEQYPVGSGAYYLHLQSINADGMPGETLDYGPFMFDFDIPEAGVVINDGSAYCNSVNVALTLMCGDGMGSGVSFVQFSNDGALWSHWESAAPVMAWTLAPGDGAKTVYIQCRDAVGNVSEVAGATVFLDTVEPVFSGLVATPATATEDDVVMLTFTASEALLAPPEVVVNGHAAEDVSGKDGLSYTYSYTVQDSQHDPSGPAEIVVSGHDLAGNLGALSSTDALTIEQKESVPVAGVFGLIALIGLIAERGTRKLRRE